MTTDQVPVTPPPKRDFRFGTADARARRAGVRETEKAVTRLRVRPTRSSERSRASSPALTEPFPLFRSRPDNRLAAAGPKCSYPNPLLAKTPAKHKTPNRKCQHGFRGSG